MSGTLTATVTIELTASPASVWNALITPELIKQYLFGTETECDWKIGSPIFFRGEYNGVKYEDKGVILDIEREKVLRYTYWSSMSGTADLPQNYSVVMFTLARSNSGTRVTLQQEGMKDEKAREHSEQNWRIVLETFKKIVEQ